MVESYAALCILRCYFNIINLLLGESWAGSSEVLITRMERPLGKFPQKREERGDTKGCLPQFQSGGDKYCQHSQVTLVAYFDTDWGCSRYYIHTEGRGKLTKWGRIVFFQTSYMEAPYPTNLWSDMPLKWWTEKVWFGGDKYYRPNLLFVAGRVWVIANCLKEERTETAVAIPPPSSCPDWEICTF